jgi:hypothetical protein
MDRFSKRGKRYLLLVEKAMQGSNVMVNLDPLEHRMLIGISLLALLFGVSFVVAVIDKGKRIDQSVLQIILAHVIYVPLEVYYTLWCYRHPERLAALPDAWMYDMRIGWPWFAILDVILLAWFARQCFKIRFGWPATAVRHLQRAHELLSQGKIAEADAAYEKGRWILEHKCK